MAPKRLNKIFQSRAYSETTKEKDVYGTGFASNYFKYTKMLFHSRCAAGTSQLRQATKSQRCPQPQTIKQAIKNSTITTSTHEKAVRQNGKRTKIDSKKVNRCFFNAVMRGKPPINVCAIWQNAPLLNAPHQQGKVTYFQSNDYCTELDGIGRSFLTTRTNISYLAQGYNFFFLSHGFCNFYQKL